jgi:hypothetical protein
VVIECVFSTFYIGGGLGYSWKLLLVIKIGDISGEGNGLIVDHVTICDLLVM